MGISPSKRVKSSLSNSPEFDSACTSAFTHCLSLTEHGFNGVFPFQLATASDHLYQTLRHDSSHSLVIKWVPSPPSRSQVDSTLKAVMRSDSNATLGPAQFKQWAVELFAGAFVANATKDLMVRVPVGVAGIAGLGAASRFGKDMVVRRTPWLIDWWSFLSLYFAGYLERKGHGTDERERRGMEERNRREDNMKTNMV